MSSIWFQETPSVPHRGRQMALAILAIVLLGGMVLGIHAETRANWLVVLAYVVLATVGQSLLLILFAVQVTEPTARGRRQFGLGTVLLAMTGLAMLLAGVGGLLRLARFNPAQMKPPEWVALICFLVLLILFGIPLLTNLLELLVAMANAVIRLPVARHLLARWMAIGIRRHSGSRGSAWSEATPAAERPPALPTGLGVVNCFAPTPESSRDAAYIHGTSESEQARLELLNRLTNRPFVEFLDVRPGTRILEVGSGLGILAADVAARADFLEVVGLEQSSQQIIAAVQSPRVRYVQGDAHALPFPDATFDLVYCRYLLEHVADPARVLAEMRRVVRPGGRVCAMENDISLVRLDPPCAAFDEVWSAFAEYQRRLGGDGLIGRRLFRLFRAAGLTQIELSVQPELHWRGSPGFAGWIENLAGNIRSAERGLVESGLCTTEQLRRAAGELSALLQRDDASMTFVWNRAVGVR